MSKQTKNSCAKAFGNRSKNKNLKPKKSREGGQIDFPPPFLMLSRVRVMFAPFTNFGARTSFHMPEQVQRLFSMLLDGPFV